MNEFNEMLAPAPEWKDFLKSMNNVGWVINMMKKAIVWDPVMRSSAQKYDPCIKLGGGKCKIECEDVK